MNKAKRILLEQALDLWESFKDEVYYKNRFIVKHSILNYIRTIAEKSDRLLDEDTILYRARIFKDDSLVEALTKANNKNKIDAGEKSIFWGYDEEGSFVPKDNNVVVEGRTNPALIKYLYTAESPYTALAEVRPYINDKVSVAEIGVLEEMKIVDFSYKRYTESKTLEDMLLLCIMTDFAQPININKHEYIPTQYIAEYLKNLGYDGIRFNSSLHKCGFNITIFNYYKCKAISSKLYRITNFCIESDCISPVEEQGLIHPKIKNNFIIPKTLVKNNS